MPSCARPIALETNACCSRVEGKGHDRISVSRTLLAIAKGSRSPRVSSSIFQAGVDNRTHVNVQQAWPCFHRSLDHDIHDCLSHAGLLDSVKLCDLAFRICKGTCCLNSIGAHLNPGKVHL